MTHKDEIDEILVKYADMIYRLAFSWTKHSADAEDILQEVFIKYIRAEVCFETDKHLKAWLIRVTINCCKNLLRSAWFRRTIFREEPLITELREESDVYGTVLELPQKYRVVIHLYYYEGYQVGEIAKLLQIKESTVKSQLKRARNMLKAKLGEERVYV